MTHLVCLQSRQTGSQTVYIGWYITVLSLKCGKFLFTGLILIVKKNANRNLYEFGVSFQALSLTLADRTYIFDSSKPLSNISCIAIQREMTCPPSHHCNYMFCHRSMSYTVSTCAKTHLHPLGKQDLYCARVKLPVAPSLPIFAALLRRWRKQFNLQGNLIVKSLSHRNHWKIEGVLYLF